MAMQTETVNSASFSEDEQSLIVTDLVALRKNQISDFLASVGLPKSGTKEVLRERVEQALGDGSVTIPQIVAYLDSVVPWGKQHVYLYKGPQTSIADWRKVEWVSKHLKQHRLGKLLNASLPLVLPDKMKISSIVHDGKRLRVTAVKRRDWLERNTNYDDTRTTDAGEEVELRAYVHRVTRSLVAIEWDLVSNQAFLQISQLPRGCEYDDVVDEFFELTEKWLDRSMFTVVELQTPIKKLHELEENGNGEIRSHGINYRTLQGRRFEGKSASPTDPLLGEKHIDSALSAIRKTGIGHLGNFYWTASTNGHAHILTSDVHVIVVGSRNRVNFPTPNSEETVRHVLSRIRSHCA